MRNGWGQAEALARPGRGPGQLVARPLKFDPTMPKTSTRTFRAGRLDPAGRCE